MVKATKEKKEVKKKEVKGKGPQQPRGKTKRVSEEKAKAILGKQAEENGKGTESPKSEAEIAKEAELAVERMRLAIAQQDNQRGQSCQETINRVLAKFNCKMFVRSRIVGGRIVSDIVVKPKGPFDDLDDED